MSYTRRNCDFCNKSYIADNRNLRRGWGKCCSKSCAASKRERSRPDYDPERVRLNNIKRESAGREWFAKQRGYPSYEEYEDAMAMDDGSWDAGGGIELDICNVCSLVASHCRCGEEAY